MAASDPSSQSLPNYSGASIGISPKGLSSPHQQHAWDSRKLNNCKGEVISTNSPQNMYVICDTNKNYTKQTILAKRAVLAF